MNNEFVSVVNTGTLTLVTTILKLDGTTKTIKIHEGDFIEDLTYLDSGKLHTVTGVVRVLKYGVKSNWTSDPHMHKIPEYKPSLCIHDTVSTFSDKVVPTHLIMDCSTEYISDIRLIPVDAIRDFQSIDLGEEMKIENITVQDYKTVSFLSNTKPIAVVWNNDTYVPVQLDSAVEVYTITVDTMKLTNEMIVIDTMNRFETMVHGVAPEVINSPIIGASYSTVMSDLIANYYNKYTDINSVDILDDDYYIPVLIGVGNTAKITLEDDVYIKDEPVRLSIGNNSNIVKDVFMIKNGVLYIAAPLLNIFASSAGRLSIGVNKFNCVVYTSASATSSISLTGVSVYGGIQGYNNTIELDDTSGIPVVKLSREDGTAAAGWLLTVDGNNVVQDTILITKKEYSNGDPTAYGITMAIGNDTITDATFNYYLNGPIVEPVNRTISYKVVIPNTGSIIFDIEVTETIPTPPVIDNGDDIPTTPDEPTDTPSDGDGEPSDGNTSSGTEGETNTPENPGSGENTDTPPTNPEGDDTPQDTNDTNQEPENQGDSTENNPEESQIP